MKICFAISYCPTIQMSYIRFTRYSLQVVIDSITAGIGGVTVIVRATHRCNKALWQLKKLFVIYSMLVTNM